MAVIVDVRGVPGLLNTIDALEGKDRANAERRAVRAAAKPFQAALKAVAAGANVPRSFQKVPAPRVSTRGGSSGREITATVRPKSPLFNIFEPGAGAHEIAPRHGDALLGVPGSGSWDNDGRKRPGFFVSRKPVRHPGFRARPILPRAFAAGEPAAVDAFVSAIFGHGGKTIGAIE